MAMITNLLIFFFGVLSATISRLLADEAKEWTPWIIEKLVQRAVARLAGPEQNRFSEEWRSHINDIPGNFGKLWVAFGFLSASRKMARSQYARSVETLLSESIKRTGDTLIAGSCLAMTLPILAVLALALYLSGRRPLVGRWMMGRNGRPFKMFTFRNSTELVWQINAAGRALRRPIKSNTLHETMLDRFVWKYGLDYVPSIFNVLRGDMAFVGPRPMSIKVAQRLSKNNSVYKRRNLVKPGLTGLWQVSYYETTNWASEIGCDLYYIENRTTVLDWKILSLTFAQGLKILVLGEPE